MIVRIFVERRRCSQVPNGVCARGLAAGAFPSALDRPKLSLARMVELVVSILLHEPLLELRSTGALITITISGSVQLFSVRLRAAALPARRSPATTIRQLVNYCC